ncbi:MAG: amino acid ABC transporter ATP-binding protein [Erysipelotrichaceae bacterium]|nr:amino acid ABC transporter ATP-binding protein [Erysipelotrichaceae bacterium]
MLEVKDLKKSFFNNEVLKGVNLTIEKGDRVAIIGPSGCGKSTLLRCFNMLEKPNSGKVIFDGQELTMEDVQLSFVRRKMGMVFQQFNLFPHLTVLDNIILAPVVLSVLSNEEAKKRAFLLLRSIGLEDKANSYPNQLSGGQKQRVAIVRTLIMDPEIILFDEPTSALDPEMVGEVLDLIMEVANRGITMVLVSHEMNFVKKFANKVIFLDEGKISFMGSVDEAFSQNDNVRLQDFLAKTAK